jgi:[acyl-carrier-protein] S-malonyltransferase
MTIAWLFPGQGSQFVGMGREVLDASPAARQVLEEVDAALAVTEGGGPRLSTIILEGPEETLTLTANAQPALVAMSQAILAAMKERVPSLKPPACAAGHSLGEYSALVASGAIALGDAIRLVRARGRAMQDAVAPNVGAMAAVMGLDAETIEAVCKEAAAAIPGEIVSPANFNAPGQVVIAGHAAAVLRASELASARKGRVVPLKVSAPFHCALMAPAARMVEAELQNVRVVSPSFPVVANVDAVPNSDASRIKQLLVRQVDGPVRWEDCVKKMQADGVRLALEIGPGKVLAGLVKRIAKDIKVLSVSDLASIDAVATFLETPAS